MLTISGTEHVRYELSFMSLKELANSIKNNGLLNPIIVRPKNNGRYEIISGHITYKIRSI